MDLTRSGSVELHPLENPLILDHIFDYCSTKELKSCRQVSKLWHDTCSKAWRSSVVLIIISGAGSKCSMSEFLEFVRNTRDNYSEAPFTKFFLDEDFSPFWELCGSHVKVMELWRVRFKSVDDFRNVVYESCPNMEQLTLRHVKVVGERQPFVEPTEWMEPKFRVNRNLTSLSLILFSEEFPVSWMELVNHFPSLMTINLRALMDNHDKLFRAVSLTRKHDPKKLNLKHIYTECVRSFNRIPEGLIQVLSDCTLHLESLSMQINGDQGTSGLSDVFSFHGDSLKKLELQRNDASFEPPLECSWCIPSHVKFGNLQEIVFYSQVFATMSILRWTPHLKKLVFFTGCSATVQSTNLAEMEHLSLRNFRELEIHWEMISVHDLQKLMDWLPNVQSLEMPLRNELFALVCERWPSLLTLKINDSRVDDSGITGLDLEHVEEINRIGKTCTWRPITVPRANITHLKNLESFAVLPSYLHRPADLSYCAAIYGVGELRNLKHLHIEIQNDAEEVWQQLHEQYPWP